MNFGTDKLCFITRQAFATHIYVICINICLVFTNSEYFLVFPEADESKSGDENLSSPRSPQTGRSDDVFRGSSLDNKNMDAVDVIDEEDDQPIHFKISDVTKVILFKIQCV